jgi:biopolymer transport protein ExbD
MVEVIMELSREPGRARGAINVTPLVDVVLVLLIVFLVAAPVVLREHEVDVAPTQAVGEAVDPPLVVAVSGDGSATVEADGHETTVPLIGLARVVRPVLAAHPGRTVVLRADPVLPFGIAVDAIDTLRGAGAGHVVLDRREVAAAP